MSRLTMYKKGIPQIRWTDFLAVVEKLAYYEDLEEQLMKSAEIDIENMIGEFMHYYNLKKDNRLIELPCKVGDTVWAIFPTWTPMECEVVAIEILTSTVNIETKVVDSDADRIFWPADFGKTVFPTKEEAEAKLAEVKGE